MNSKHDQNLEPVLDPISLQRHFNFVNPATYNFALFKISNLYNELKNKGNAKNKRKSKLAMKIQLQLKQILNEVEAEKKNPRNPMDVVANGLILGVIPKKDQMADIIEAAKAAKQASTPVKSIHIFSITDEFEQGMPEMLQPKDFGNQPNSIAFFHHQVPMTDFGAEISSQSILATVYKMRQIIEDDGTVYIHCKAGKARSAMIVATYLAIYGDEKNKLTINTDIVSDPPLKQAISYLKLKRSQVDLHDDKIKSWKDFMKEDGNFAKLQKAQEAINLHDAISKKIQKENITTNDYINKFNDETKNKWENIKWDKAPEKKNRIKNIIQRIIKKEPVWEFKNGESTFSSLQFKNYLTNLTSFKQLKIYATQSQNLFKKTSKRTNYIKEFLKTIYTAKDDNWFVELKKGEGPLGKLMNNSKATEEMKTTIINFINDLGKYKEIELQKQNGLLLDQKLEFTNPAIGFKEFGLFSHAENKNLKIKIFKLINAIEKRNDGNEMNSDDEKMILTLEKNLEHIKKNNLKAVNHGEINNIEKSIQPSKKLTRI